VKRLLVADDSETILLLLEKRLRLAGYEVETATDGQQVVDRVTESEPDAILLDAMMPVKSGLEALRELRGAGCDVPVVMVSAHRDSEELRGALAAGADGSVTKPIDWDELLSTVKRLTSDPPAADAG
jgi:DNA-binding response OmpR family regulator